MDQDTVLIRFGDQLAWCRIVSGTNCLGLQLREAFHSLEIQAVTSGLRGIVYYIKTGDTATFVECVWPSHLHQQRPDRRLKKKQGGNPGLRKQKYLLFEINMKQGASQHRSSLM